MVEESVQSESGKTSIEDDKMDHVDGQGVLAQFQKGVVDQPLSEQHKDGKDDHHIPQSYKEIVV